MFLLLPLDLAWAAGSAVQTGIDVLEREHFARLAGRRVGLITNQTGVNREGKCTIDLFRNAGNLQLIALFSPEHGLLGNVDRKVSSAMDERTGLPVYSLYGVTRRPTSDMLQRIDILVFDIQDIGARFYTYISTMGYAMEEAARAGIEFMVLDRPNPLTGTLVEGPVLEAQRTSFTGYFPLPVRHGMTTGELAMLFNEGNRIGVRLQVVKMEGWERTTWFDKTDLPWVNPSPNIRSLCEATLYPAIGLLESSNLSVGRGTPTPFEVLGAPWIRASRLASLLNAKRIPGVRFRPVHFTPRSDRYENRRCHGVGIEVTDRERFRSIQCGLEIARTLALQFPRHFQVDKLVDMVGAETIVNSLKHGMSFQRIEQSYHVQLQDFLALRDKYLLY